MEHQTFYQRNLPHIQPKEGTFFITYRLYGSVPIPIIKSLRDNFDFELKMLEKNIFQTQEEKYEELPFDLKKQLQTVFKKKKYHAGKMYFKHFDDYLGNNLNEPYWLKTLPLPNSIWIPFIILISNIINFGQLQLCLTIFMFC